MFNMTHRELFQQIFNMSEFTFNHESRQRILNKGNKRKREKEKSPILKGC